MKVQQRLTAILAAAFILSDSFLILTVKADQPLEETITAQDSTATNDKDVTEDASSSEIVTTPEETTESITEEETVKTPPQETTCATKEETDETVPSESAINIIEITDETMPSKSVTEIMSDISDETSLLESSLLEPTTEIENKNDFPVPDEAPMFDARIVYEMGDYIVIGTFTDFTPDIKLIDTLYSLDNVNWQTAIGGKWNLCTLGTKDEHKLSELQNQRCLFGSYEPLKNYKAGEIDHFYLKLRITKENGLSYETQSATIEHNGLQSIPEGTKCMARFSSAIAVRETKPYCYYGKYQLTVCAEATAENISELLPDTLPVEVQLIGISNFNATCIVDCPVTWKPLSLPQLSAGESITIPDAAEEILVPKGTLLNTPLGTFQLDQPLSLNTDYSTDEVRLVLNISPETKNPTGVLREERNGLEIAFHQKPTGATSIQAYVLTEGDSKWSELLGLSLLKELNAHSSTANSDYALVLRNDQEPYRSYLAAVSTGETPTPFFVGLKIEGGIYDGQQLILAWPNIYEQLPYLPEIDGAGGNEGNVGADNKDDSTESGQRPNLPQTPDDDQEAPQPNPPSTLPLASEENAFKQQLPPTPTPENQNPSFTDESVSDHQGNNYIPEQLDPIPPKPEVSESGQRPDLPQTTWDTVDTSSENQDDSRTFERFDNSMPFPLVVQAATDIKNEEITTSVSNAETTIAHSTKDNNRVPFLPVTITVITISCIIITAYKTAGYHLFSRITRKIQNTLHK